jgi:hypothetical protein
MMKLTSVFAAGVLCTIGAITSHAQTLTCANAQYDPALLQKYPNLPKSCLDIVSRDGEDYAVVKAQLDKVMSNNSVYVRTKQPDGTYGERHKLRIEADQRVLVEGKPTRISDLATGQELTAYVKVREPAMALEPVGTAHVYSTPLEEPEQMAALPSTGSLVPLLGILGSISLLFGGLLTAIRYRR